MHHLSKWAILSLLWLACTAMTARAGSQKEFDSLHHIGFSGRLDTGAVHAIETMASYYWQTRPDSVRKYTPILQNMLERLIADDADPLSILRIEFGLGEFFKNSNDPDLSITYLFSALARAESIGDQDIRTTICREIGLNYYLQANWLKAAEYFSVALRHYKRTGNKPREQVMAYLVGLSLNNSGRYTEGLEVLRGVYAFSQARQDTQRILESGAGLADAYRGIGELDSAEAQYRYLMVVGHANDFDHPAMWAVLHSGLARVLFQQNRINEAIKQAKTALALSREFDYFFPRLEAERTLYESFALQGDYQNAFLHLKQYTHDHDSLQSSETTTRLGVAQALYDYQKREDTILAEEARKRQVMIVVASLTSILVLIVAFFYRSLSKQKRTSEALLANILPKEAIAELKADGTIAAKVHSNVSIMFADVQEFTVIAEALTPNQLVEMLDTHIKAFDLIMRRHGLEKIKTIGDAYMVAGGLHNADLNYAEQCVLAAQDMLSYAAEVAPFMKETYGFQFHYRIGIHTGSVISGMVGQDKYAYDIWGDAVNVASRLEHHSEIGRINISGATRTLLPDTVECEYRGKISAKNKGDIDMYFVGSAAISVTQST